MNCELDILGQALRAGAPAPPSVPTGPAAVASLPSLQYASLTPVSGLCPRGPFLWNVLPRFSVSSILHGNQISAYNAISSGRSLLVAISEPTPLTNLVLHPPSPPSPSQHFSLLAVQFSNLVDLFIVCTLHENVNSMTSEFFFFIHFFMYICTTQTSFW